MIKPEIVISKIHSVLEGGDILLIVPPFATAKNPLLGVHILAAQARDLGYKTEILYLNMLLADVIGMEDAEYVCYPPFEMMWMMLHERLFARSAFGLPPLGKNPEYCGNEAMSVAGNRAYPEVIFQSDQFDLDRFMGIEKTCTEFVDHVIEALMPLAYKMIGCSIRMGQTNCSVALLDRIKEKRPDIVTLIGGPACKDSQALGIASLTQSIDYVFSGECDLSFPKFLVEYAEGKLPSDRIIYGEFQTDLDKLPFPDFSSFMHQVHSFLGEKESGSVIVCYESSRGCWWGEQNRCFFCSEDNACRQKSPEKVVKDLKKLSEDSRIAGVYMCDVAMPRSYYEDVLPALLADSKCPHIYYQSKVNISLKDVINLKKARVSQLTFGLESFSTGLLKTMNKGTLARHNLRLLRNARSVGLLVHWLLLWGFPLDKAKDYRDTLELLPLIRHFQPPMSCIHMILSKGSPYFMRAREFQIENIRPMAVYKMIFPQWADLDNLAFWFAADYPSGSHENPGLMKALGKQIRLWQQLWETTYLTMVPLGDAYLILDNRDCTGKEQYLVDGEKAFAVMKSGEYTGSQYQQWALEKKLGVVMDSRYMSLVTSSAELLLQFESAEFRR